MANPDDQFGYDIAISFAGEDSAVAGELANLPMAKHIEVFYDE